MTDTRSRVSTSHQRTLCAVAGSGLVVGGFASLLTQAVVSDAGLALAVGGLFLCGAAWFDRAPWVAPHLLAAGAVMSSAIWVSNAIVGIPGLATGFLAAVSLVAFATSLLLIVHRSGGAAGWIWLLVGVTVVLAYTLYVTPPSNQMG